MDGPSQLLTIETMINKEGPGITGEHTILRHFFLDLPRCGLVQRPW